MEVTQSTQYRDITVAGVTLSAPAPYSEGHVLTVNEAQVLNQTLAENLRNNFASHVKAVSEAAGGNENLNMGELQSQFDAYIGEYEFGVRKGGGGGPRLDERTRIAINLAKAKVREQIKRKGLSLKQFGPDKIHDLAVGLVEKNDWFYKEADRQIKESQKAAAQVLDIDADLDALASDLPEGDDSQAAA